MIQLDDEQYWLYAAVDPGSNDLLHTRLRPTRNNAITDQFFAELRDKHDVDNATFLIDDVAPLQRACHKHDLDFIYERYENRNNIERVFCEVKHRTTSSQTVLATPKQKQQTSGSNPSPSHGISIFKHYLPDGGVQIRMKNEAERSSSDLCQKLPASTEVAIASS